MRHSQVMRVAFSSFIVVWQLLMAAGAPAAAAAQPPKAQSPGAGQSAIAYVLPNDVTGDEIHLIDPDGAHDRNVWHTGTSGLTTGPDVAELAWRPDAGELAFWSRFQEDCSFYNGDIYAIRPDGSGFRRQTAPPACKANLGLPTGTVRLGVYNNTGIDATFVVYIEGAPGGKFVTLADGSSTTVTFNNVVDYGSGVQQWAVAIYGYDRYTYVSAHADVIPGQTVSPNTPLLLDSPTQHWGWNSPTYNSDGSEMAYFFGSGTIYHAPSYITSPGGVGTYLLANGLFMPGNPTRLQWGRGAHAHQLLYEGFDWDSIGDAIYLVNEGSANPGAKVLVIDPYNEGLVNLGLAWLPDGSGFLYSATEKDPDTRVMFGNIFEYKFATQQSVRRTNFTSGFPRDLAISPDGTKVVFEYQATGEWSDLNPPIDLWMMNRDGSGAALFVKKGQSPAWSPVALPVYRYVYLPSSMR